MVNLLTEGGVKNDQNLAYVVYGCPFKIPRILEPQNLLFEKNEKNIRETLKVVSLEKIKKTVLS